MYICSTIAHKNPKFDIHFNYYFWKCVEVILWYIQIHTIST